MAYYYGTEDDVMCGFGRWPLHPSGLACRSLPVLSWDWLAQLVDAFAQAARDG